jgi:hypothetical protein
LHAFDVEALRWEEITDDVCVGPRPGVRSEAAMVASSDALYIYGGFRTPGELLKDASKSRLSA